MTTPNALKSFALKFVELLHSIDLLQHSQEPATSVVKSFFGRALGGRSTAADDTLVRIRDLQTQAGHAVRVLNLWQGSHLLMDEVDVILHPLKSELNYPIGPREPLDFTDNKAGKVRNREKHDTRLFEFWAPSLILDRDPAHYSAHARLSADLSPSIDAHCRSVLIIVSASACFSPSSQGLRFELPYHLMDALFFATSGQMMNTGSAKESRQMAAVLDKLKLVVKQGQAERSVQRVPHFVVLRKQFYTAHLQPLLAEWMLIWLGAKGLSGLTDHQVLEFLKKVSADAISHASDRCGADSLLLQVLKFTLHYFLSFSFFLHLFPWHRAPAIPLQPAQLTPRLR